MENQNNLTPEQVKEIKELAEKEMRQLQADAKEKALAQAKARGEEVNEEEQKVIDNALNESIKQMKSLPDEKVSSQLEEIRYLQEMRKFLKPVVYYGETGWRKQATLVKPEEFGTSEFETILKHLEATALIQEAAGFAAIQLGIDKDVFCVVEWENRRPVDTRFFINAKIVEQSESEYAIDEGCFTFHQMLFKSIARPGKVTIEYQDKDGNTKVEDFGIDIGPKNEVEFRKHWKFLKTEERKSFMLARAILHEMEHNAGGSLLDHMSSLTKTFWLKKYNNTLSKARKLKQ